MAISGSTAFDGRRCHISGLTCALVWSVPWHTNTPPGLSRFRCNVRVVGRKERRVCQSPELFFLRFSVGYQNVLKNHKLIGLKKRWCRGS